MIGKNIYDGLSVFMTDRVYRQTSEDVAGAGGPSTICNSSQSTAWIRSSDSAVHFCFDLLDALFIEGFPKEYQSTLRARQN
jgi:hypothetical protein